MAIPTSSGLESAKAKLSQCEKAAIAAREGVDGLLTRFDAQLKELKKLPSIRPAGSTR